MRQTISRTGRTPGPRPVTGYTVLAWMVGFFAVIFAANGVFIYLAAGSFPGLEVSSAYKAGQEYNGEIAAAAAQSARGWNVSASAQRAGDGAAQAAAVPGRKRWRIPPAPRKRIWRSRLAWSTRPTPTTTARPPWSKPRPAPIRPTSPAWRRAAGGW